MVCEQLCLFMARFCKFRVWNPALRGAGTGPESVILGFPMADEIEFHAISIEHSSNITTNSKVIPAAANDNTHSGSLKAFG
jgi:hypothetical protein